MAIVLESVIANAAILLGLALILGVFAPRLAFGQAAWGLGIVVLAGASVVSVPLGNDQSFLDRIAGVLEHLGHFAASDGYSNERYDAFLARDVTPDGTLQRESTEQIEVELQPMSTLREWALRGDITDAPTALAILLAAERLRDRP